MSTLQRNGSRPAALVLAHLHAIRPPGAASAGEWYVPYQRLTRRGEKQ